MKGSPLRRMSVVIAVCAFVGALAGIAGSAAAPSKSKTTEAQKAKAKALKNQAKAQFRAGRAGPGGPGFFGGHGGPGGGAVHSETVVPNADGTGFDKITTDAGKLTSVDGNTLNITEGTDKKKYKDVAIDVGSSPTVIRNRATAKLSDLKPDDQVHVIQGGPKGTIVIAEDAAFSAQQKKDHQGFGRGHGGPPPGPPPGAPANPPGNNQNGSDSSGSSSSGTNS
jgi:hypothetical protein